MKRFKTLCAVAFAVSLVCGPAARAQDPPPLPEPGWGSHRPPLERALGPGPSGRWWNEPAMIEKLNLTDAQRKGMDAILLEHREKLIDLHAALEKSELAMEPLISADQPNEQLILAQIDKTAQSRAELEKANARFLLAVRAKLTPDQWKQLQAARADRRQMRGPDGAGPHPMMHRRGGPGGGPASGPSGGPGGPPPAAPQFAPGDGPGPQGMLPPGPSPDLALGTMPDSDGDVVQ